MIVEGKQESKINCGNPLCDCASTQNQSHCCFFCETVKIEDEVECGCEHDSCDGTRLNDHEDRE